MVELFINWICNLSSNQWLDQFWMAFLLHDLNNRPTTGPAYEWLSDVTAYGASIIQMLTLKSYLASPIVWSVQTNQKKSEKEITITDFRWQLYYFVCCKVILFCIKLSDYFEDNKSKYLGEFNWYYQDEITSMTKFHWTGPKARLKRFNSTVSPFLEVLPLNLGFRANPKKLYTLEHVK